MTANVVSDCPDSDYRISLSLRRSWRLLALVGVTFALRVVFLDAQSLWRDEVDALNFATAPWSEVWGNFLRPGWNGPLYFLLLRGWVALTGRTAFALRFFSLLWGVLAIPLMYALGRRRLDARAARWAAVLAAFSPYLIWYSAEVKMYSWVPFLILLAFYALDRACVTPRWGWWALTVAGISLAVYSHILAALSIPVAVLWFCLHPRRHPRAWVGALAALAALTLPYLPLLAWQFPMVLADRGVTGFPALTFGQMAGSLLAGWSAGVPAMGGAVASWGSAALGMWGGWTLIRRRRWRTAAALGAWIFVPLGLIWWVSLRGPLFTDRYLIWAAPAFYLLLGAGLAGLRGRWARQGVMLALMLIAGANLSAQLLHPYKPQFREAAVSLRLRRLPEDLLLFQIPYNRIMLDYYSPTPLEPWAEAPYTNFRDAEGRYTVTFEAVDAQLRALTQGYRRVWLVYSEATLWDERELVKAWLDANGRLLYEQQFLMVSLGCYELP